jgi:hypothetical protein
MNFDTVTGIFSCTPALTDILEYHTLNVQVQDEFANITGFTTYPFLIHIYANSAPTLNTAFVDLIYKAGSTFTFSFNADAFIDPEGETVIYSYNTGSDDFSSWLTFDSATRTFTIIPHANDDVGVHTIYINADDINVNSAAGITSFVITVTENQLPEFDAGFGPPPINATVHYSFSYILPLNAFRDPDGETYTIAVAVVPNEWSVVYNSGDRSINGTLSDNTKYGVYDLSFTLTDEVGGVAVKTLAIEYYKNLPPYIITNASPPSAIIAHYALDYSVPKSYFGEPESENFTFSFKVNDTSLGSWVTMTENVTHIHFQGTPMNFQHGTIILSIVIKDIYTDTGEVVENVNLTVNRNQVPYLLGSPVAPSSQIVGIPWFYEFNFDWMNDHEMEVLSHTCSSSPVDGWMT